MAETEARAGEGAGVAVGTASTARGEPAARPGGGGGGELMVPDPNAVGQLTAMGFPEDQVGVGGVRGREQYHNTLYCIACRTRTRLGD